MAAVVTCAALLARANEPKQVWLIPNAGHVDFYRFRPAEYEARLLAFLLPRLMH